LCRTFNNEIHAKVKINKHLSSKCKVKKALGQRDGITPLMFNIVLEMAIRRSKVEIWGTVFDICS